MYKLDHLKINQWDETHIEAILTERNTLLEIALREENIAILKAIASIDAENKSWLIAYKKELGQKIGRVDKVQQYHQASS